MRKSGSPLTVALLAGLLLWAGCTPPVLQTDTPAPAFDEAAFWESFPLPDDAQVVSPPQGYGFAFASGLVEPELFDSRARWLRDRGWSQQAPTEAQITLPHQRWRKGNLELLIELQPVDEEGRTMVWMQVKSLAEG
jgi:hypothetical protein